MENIISRIVDIENKAKDIVKQAIDASEELPETIARELEDYRAALEGELEADYNVECEKIEKELRSACDGVTTEMTEASELLRAAYAKHGDEWAAKLFESVTGDV